MTGGAVPQAGARVDREPHRPMICRFVPSVAVIAATALAAAVPAPGFAAGADAPAGWRVAAGDPPNSATAASHKSSAKKASKAGKPAAGEAAAEKSAAKKAADSEGEPKSGKPVQVGSFGDWGAFLAEGGKEGGRPGKDKTCYALTTPKERAPAKLKRDPAYVFISNRPGEKVRNEVSVIMGFAMKDGEAAHADISGENFDLVAKGANAWIKNPAEETRFVEALKKGSKLIVKAPSVKGNVTTDTYSLAGISEALDKVHKDCP